jgi:hypothetical protein
MGRLVSHTVALWAVLGSPALAANVRLNDACRAPGEVTEVRGTGFTAGSPFTTALDGVPLGLGTVDELGAASARFPAPAREGSYTVHVTDLLGGAASTPLTVRRASLSLVPRPRTASGARVRFVIDGLGADGDSVWAHWVAPGGHVTNRRLGVAAGACGSLRTARRRLLPAGARSGRWRLQIDTRMSYSRSATPRVVQNIRVG